MATRKEITCINKSDRNNIHKRIKNVGGYLWKHTLNEAIAYIENGTYSYYVTVGSNTTDVYIATSAAGNKYLKTHADSIIVDNLLSLKNCV